MRKILIVVFVAAALMPFFSGCANYIKDYEASEDRVIRTPIGSKHDIIFKPTVPVDSEFTAVAITVNKEKVKKIQVFIKGKIETPYNGWREFYEFPCGLVLVPVSLCSHIISVFTFGVYPFSFSSHITDLAYTGLNPALNWESESRSVRTPVESKEKLVDEQEEDKIIPIANAVISLKSGERNWKLPADKFGEAKVKLISLKANESVFVGDRELVFSIVGEKDMSRNLLLTREFASKLLRARATIQRYQFGGSSGKKLVQAVKQLEGMKFTRLAYQLEKQELMKHKNHTRFMNEFNSVSME